MGAGVVQSRPQGVGRVLELGHRGLDVAHNITRLAPHVLGHERRCTHRHTTDNHALCDRATQVIANDDRAHRDA